MVAEKLHLEICFYFFSIAVRVWISLRVSFFSCNHTTRKIVFFQMCIIYLLKFATCFSEKPGKKNIFAVQLTALSRWGRLSGFVSTTMLQMPRDLMSLKTSRKPRRSVLRNTYCTFRGTGSLRSSCMLMRAGKKKLISSR